MSKNYTKGAGHLFFFAAVWWLLTSGDAASWIVGVIVVPLAAWISIVLCKPAASYRPDTKLSMLRLLLFIPFFLLQSLRGGWSTACLAIRPGSAVSPGFIDYHIQLTCESARLFLLHVVSLLPGTVSVSLQGNIMRVHALVLSPQIDAELDECERRVAHLFSLNRSSSHDKGTP